MATARPKSKAGTAKKSTTGSAKAAPKRKPAAARRTDTRSPRDKAIDAAMALAAANGWNALTLKQIADRARLPLGQLLAEFPSKLAILRGFIDRIDRQVMDKLDPDLSEEPARERLLDVMIARFEALAPYKDALRAINSELSRDPDALLTLNGRILRSQMAMLAAAEISAEGVSGAAKAQALALLHARVFRVWLDDDDPGMARTMAELDRRLRSGERVLERVSGLSRVFRLGSAFTSALWRAARERRGRGGASAADPMDAA